MLWLINMLERIKMKSCVAEINTIFISCETDGNTLPLSNTESKYNPIQKINM